MSRVCRGHRCASGAHQLRFNYNDEEVLLIQALKVWFEQINLKKEVCISVSVVVVLHVRQQILTKLSNSLV